MKKRDILERRRTIPERIFFVVAFVLLGIWSLIVLYMLIWASPGAYSVDLELAGDERTIVNLGAQLIYIFGGG